MKRTWFIVSWLALAAGIMLVVGGIARVQVREAHRAYGDPFRQVAIESIEGRLIEPYPEYRLGSQHVVAGSGMVVLAAPGMILSLRRRHAS